MKFRNPKTGKVFNEIWPLFNMYCASHNCDNCALPTYCVRYCIDFPKEAAALMGYEVMEENSDNLSQTLINDDKTLIKVVEIDQVKEANMDKPLKDWTLGEVKEYCTGSDCYNGCKLVESPGKCKILDVPPCEWDLGEKPRFTQQEVEDAQAIRRVFGRDGFIKRKSNSGERSMLLFDYLYINPNLFPSIKPGQNYTLDEIIGGANGHQPD